MYSIPYTRVRTLIHLLARCSLAGKAVLLGPSLLSKNFPNFKLLECLWYDSKMIFKYNSTTISFLHIEGQRRPCTQVWRGRCLLRRACGHVDVGTRPHQVLASTLTLSQPGGQIMPTLY